MRAALSWLSGFREGLLLMLGPYRMLGLARSLGRWPTDTAVEVASRFAARSDAFVDASLIVDAFAGFVLDTFAGV